MVGPPEIHDPSKFDDFHVHHVTYKVVSGHPIDLSILVPKRLVENGELSEKTPLITEFHGGFLVGGNRIFSPWFSDWLIELALSRRAIIVTPDYRLLPEANGHDVLADLASFWDWLPKNMKSKLASFYPQVHIEPDFDRILATGSSAGGWMVSQSMFLHPEINIRAAIMAYPMINLRDRFWAEKYEKPIFGLPTLPYEIVESHLKSLPANAVFTTDGDIEKKVELLRPPLAIAIVQHGKYLDFFGRDTELFPFENLPRAERVPPFVWLFHGRQDSAVPCSGSEKFVSEVQKHKPDVHVRLDLKDGEHGFDTDDKVTISEGWMKEGVTELLSYW
ncbi:uncharacterized protein N7484_003712 [Penicillium longicatenatum]|uniref:uncharacterized protein n=1 Tax=Penicillium longicatenatum TaxID=1561947 RepID=UPI002546B870|nr:uncharacterized protein N7484_003712 [Penicillium longicatenatum]KAJ5649989.1 hypothetical protein N7484_003712 [Penicillium longicatenatum]